MTINFPNASRFYDHTRQAVRFWGYDQSMEASFFISAETLRRLSPEAPNNETALLQAFDRHCTRIREAAARLYGNGRKGGSYDLHPSHF